MSAAEVASRRDWHRGNSQPTSCRNFSERKVPAPRSLRSLARHEGSGHKTRPMCDGVQKTWEFKIYSSVASRGMLKETPVTDVYVYYFTRCRGPLGEKSLSKRRATLETIKGKGVAVMESQIVVDHTEVDDNGFLIGCVGNDSHPMDELWAQIRSLERRANSRDSEALTLDESGEGQRIYMLRLESRELRNQAQILKKQRADSMAGEIVNWSGAQDFLPFGASPVAA